MKIHIHPTSKIVQLETKTGVVPARIWEGETENGIPVHCFITRLAPTISKTDPRQQEFQAALLEVEAPSVALDVYPLRMIL